MEKIIVIGGRGTAINIAQHILHATRRFGISSELLGFAADDPALGKAISGMPILCRPHEILTKFPEPDVKVIFALYKPGVMRERVALRQSNDFPLTKFATFVHPSSYIASTATMGPGTVILANCTINHAVQLGAFVVINSGVVIEHDTVIADSVFLSASSCIGAHVEIGPAAFVGLNATIREHVRVGQYAFVGMASNVLQDVPVDTTVFGNPAKPTT